MLLLSCTQVQKHVSKILLLDSTPKAALHKLAILPPGGSTRGIGFNRWTQYSTWCFMQLDHFSFCFFFPWTPPTTWPHLFIGPSQHYNQQYPFIILHQCNLTYCLLAPVLIGKESRMKQGSMHLDQSRGAMENGQEPFFSSFQHWHSGSPAWMHRIWNRLACTDTLARYFLWLLQRCQNEALTETARI